MTTSTTTATAGLHQTVGASLRISIATIGALLVGRRRAILRVASSAPALWLGLLFVFSAGLAREYDGEDLMREPWHLVIPLAASLATSFVLFCLISLVGRGTFERASFLGSYRALLTVYWMTAPLAWLYAIPFERFLSASGAVQANLWLLALVAGWRVILMIRIITVLYSTRAWHALILVMLFADVVAQIAIAVSPRPIFSVMGGVRQTESELMLLNATHAVQILGFLSLPVWIIGLLFVALSVHVPDKPQWKHIALPTGPASRISHWLWLCGLVSIVGWMLVLPATQTEQHNRFQVVNDMRAGRIAAALQFMSQRTPADFPPHWDPPPRLGYGEETPRLFEVIDNLEQCDAAPWVKTLYLQKLAFQAENIAGGYGYGVPPFTLDEMTTEQLQRYRDLLLNIDQGALIAASHNYELSILLDPRHAAKFPEISGERRQLLQDMQALAQKYQHRIPTATTIQPVSLDDQDLSGFTPIFDGQSLAGWDGDATYWSVQDGVLVGTVTPETLLKKNSWIVWTGGIVQDFELSLEYRISPDGNSGVGYRLAPLADDRFSVRGPQADIHGANLFTGICYEENGRRLLAGRGQRTVLDADGNLPRLAAQFATPEELQGIVRKEEWNRYHLIVAQHVARHYLNGQLMSEVHDLDDTNRMHRGSIGVQVHVGPPMKVEFRKILLKQMSPDSDSQDPVTYQSGSLLERDHQPTFDNLVQQAARSTAPAPSQPVNGATELSSTTREFAQVRSDILDVNLFRDQASPLPADQSGFDLVVNTLHGYIRIPGAGERAAQVSFDRDYHIDVNWNATTNSYEVRRFEPVD